MDYRGMLKKYMRMVSHAEGVTFLYKYDWSPEEWVEMEKIEQEVCHEEN
jgi:hypothetical protein